MLNNFSKNSSEKPRHSQNGRFISHSTPRIGEDHQTPISSWSRWVRRGDRREPLDGPFAPILGTGTGPLALSPPDFSLYWAGDARYCKGVAPTFFLRLLVIRLCGALCSTTTENMNPVKKLKSKLDEQMPWPREVSFFFPFSFAVHPIYYLHLYFSLSFLVVAQIRGHIAGSSPPFPLRFVPCIFIARTFQLFLLSSTRVELCLPTLGTLSS